MTCLLYTSFEQGKTCEKLHEVGTSDHTGTTVTFWPDPEIFTETTIYDYSVLAARFREMAFLNLSLIHICPQGPRDDAPQGRARLVRPAG